MRNGDKHPTVARFPSTPSCSSPPRSPYVFVPKIIRNLQPLTALRLPPFRSALDRFMKSLHRVIRTCKPPSRRSTRCRQGSFIDFFAPLPQQAERRRVVPVRGRAGAGPWEGE
ncbi:MAG: hypothetical protein Q9173_005502 [Seirophora scorigena]